MRIYLGMSLRNAVRAAKKLGVEFEDQGEYVFRWKGESGQKTLRVKGSRHDAPLHLVKFLLDIYDGKRT